jgi:hypothetical protein
MVFQGTTASSAISTASQNATDIVSYSIANKTLGAITVKVGIFYGSGITYILYNEALGAGETFIYTGDKIRVLPNYLIYVEASGSADYYFTIL